MRRIFLTALAAVMSLVSYAGPCGAADQKLPVVDGKEVVAMVNNEPITAEEYGKALAGIKHGSVEEGEKAEGIDYKSILDRLIDESLFLLEARNIGIDKLPEVTVSIEENADRTLAKMLVREMLQNVQVDQEEVERRFREVTREYKVTAVVFEKEEYAKEMEAEIASGVQFDDAVEKAIADGRALESVKGDYLKEKELWPEMSAAMSGMEAGTVSPVIKFDKGYVIARLEDIRYPADPELRERIINSLANDRRQMALDDYTKSLIKKYVKIDEKLLEKINYDASLEEFNKLMEDKRVVAKVKDGKPVTVKELSAAFQDKYYHGVEEKIKRQGLNDLKKEVLDGILQKRVMVLEAKKQGIHKTDAYRDSLERYNRTIVFEQFLNRVVVKGITFAEDELRAYYRENPASFTNPEMMRIDSLAFDIRENAEAAIRTLGTGTEFAWLKANAASQVGPDVKGVLNFGGSVLSVKLLPEGVQKVLSGGSAGDFRLYEHSDGNFYVLYIKQVFPSSVKPFEEVKNEILKDMYNERVSEALREWSDKLKEHYPVEIYLTEF